MTKDIDLRCGDYREVLANVESFDALICDPPYSARIHEGMRTLAKGDGSFAAGGETAVAFPSWNSVDCDELCDFASRRVPTWVFIMCDHILYGAHDHSWRRAGVYSFAPIPIVAHAVRMSGDGPASIPAWAFVARQRQRTNSGSLPSWYQDSIGAEKARDGGIVGGKSIALMRKIVCDYSRPGDLVCDPTAGAGTTAIACALEGRRFVGAELRPEIHAMALERIAKHTAQSSLFEVTR